MVEHMDGSKGMVVRRGSNYVSYESDGLIKKAWLYDIQMSAEQPEKKTNVLESLEKEMKSVDESYGIGTDVKVAYSYSSERKIQSRAGICPKDART